MAQIEIKLKPEDVQKASGILSGAGYHPITNRNSIEVNLNGSGEENFVYNKLRKAGIVLQEAEESITNLIATIENSDSAQAKTDWDSWASGYEFDLENADNYDMNNARARARKIIKDRKLESKMKEDILADVLGTSDPHARYRLIYEGIQSNRITFEEFVQIAGAIQSGESFTYPNDEVGVTPERDNRDYYKSAKRISKDIDRYRKKER